MAYGVALQQRFTGLILCITSEQSAPWTNYSSLCVTSSCAHLKRLVLSGVSITLEALLPLRQLTALTQLVVKGDGVVVNTLDVLEDFSRLQHLHLQSADDADAHLPFADMAALAGLTRLTHLTLHWLKSFGDEVAPSQTVPTPARLNAAVAALAGLTNLCSLQLNPDSFVMDDVVWSAVRPFPRLTELTVYQILLTRPTAAGDLPLLQKIWIENIGLSALLESLLPLAPLPSLMSLNDNFLILSGAYFSVNTAPADLAAERQALQRLGVLLAAAPCLTVSMLALLSMRPYNAVMLRCVFEDLLPIAHRFTSLHIGSNTIAVQGVAEIARCLPALSTLVLVGCTVCDMCLLTINAQLSNLSVLRVAKNSGAISSNGLEALAAAPRSRLLLVSGDVFEESFDVWDAMQQRVHGCQLIRLQDEGV